MIEKLENFLLYNVSDDWAAIGEFGGTVEKIAPEEYSRAYVLAILRELADKGYIEFGAFPGGGRSWEVWTVGTEEAIRRVSHGYNGVPGYLGIRDDDRVPASGTSLRGLLANCRSRVPLTAVVQVAGTPTAELDSLAERVAAEGGSFGACVRPRSPVTSSSSPLGVVRFRDRNVFSCGRIRRHWFRRGRCPMRRG